MRQQLNGNGAEVGQEFGAATGFDAASAHAADEFRHITRTDLTHLNVCVGIQIRHVFAQGFEVDLFFLIGAVEECQT